jgi:hypothetical protein
LFERAGRHDNQIAGRSPYLQAVHVEASENHIGEIFPVLITKCGPNSLSGVIIQGTKVGMKSLDMDGADPARLDGTDPANMPQRSGELLC